MEYQKEQQQHPCQATLDLKEATVRDRGDPRTQSVSEPLRKRTWPVRYEEHVHLRPRPADQQLVAMVELVLWDAI